MALFDWSDDLIFIKCVKVNPSWAKGYARKGAALHGARRYDDAIVAYEAGIKLEDSPALRKGLQEVQDAKGMFEINHSAAPVLIKSPFLKLPQLQTMRWASGKCLLTPASLPN